MPPTTTEILSPVEVMFYPDNPENAAELVGGCAGGGGAEHSSHRRHFAGTGKQTDEPPSTSRRSSLQTGGIANNSPGLFNVECGRLRETRARQWGKTVPRTHVSGKTAAETRVERKPA